MHQVGRAAAEQRPQRVAALAILGQQIAQTGGIGIARMLNAARPAGTTVTPTGTGVAGKV